MVPVASQVPAGPGFVTTLSTGANLWVIEHGTE